MDQSMEVFSSDQANVKALAFRFEHKLDVEQVTAMSAFLLVLTHEDHEIILRQRFHARQISNGVIVFLENPFHGCGWKTNKTALASCHAALPHSP
jgi:hypothetical protein